MAVYLLRHGEIEMGPAWRFVGQIDLPLTGKGVEQARWWREDLADISFDRIYTSDLKRARNTASIIAEPGALPVEIAPELREIDLGEWDGQTREQVRERFPDQWETRGRDMAEFRPHGGERFADLQSRVVPVYEKIVRQMNSNVLIVSHSGVNRVILCHVLGMPLGRLFRLDQGYGAMNIIEYIDSNPKMTVFNRLPQVR